MNEAGSKELMSPKRLFSIIIGMGMAFAGLVSWEAERFLQAQDAMNDTLVRMQVDVASATSEMRNTEVSISDLRDSDARQWTQINRNAADIAGLQGVNRRPAP